MSQLSHPLSMAPVPASEGGNFSVGSDEGDSVVHSTAPPEESGAPFPTSAPPDHGQATVPVPTPMEACGLNGGLPSPGELEQTLQRLIRKVSMLVQAEKCVFLLHDRDRNQLVARPPAIGVGRAQIRALHLPMDSGLCACAFTEGCPVVVQSAAELGAADAAWAGELGARNLIAYPLVIERTRENPRITEQLPVGVFLVLNKRGAEPFGNDDLHLLSVMARQVTAVIADAQAYLQLTEEREQLQATLQSLGSAVLMVDSAGFISLLNPAARALFDLDDGDGVGRCYDEVVSQDAIVSLLKKAVQDGQEDQAEIEIESQGNPEPRIYQAQTAFVRGERSGTPATLGVVVIFNDITEIRNVERMKTAFVSTVSHELRTPLTSIKGFISTLLADKEGYFNEEARTEFYQIIDSECDRLRRLIDDLLNVSRIESGRALQMNWGLFEPLAVIEKVMQAQRAYATERHRLILNFQGEIPRQLGDEDKFDQILTNLVSNAIKYSPAGGDIVVAVASDDHNLTVRVSDPGIGIPRDKLSRIFEKFERVDNRDTRQAGGTGIGLFLVKHLVERHGGTVSVESELGKGTTFIVRLPLLPEVAMEELK